MQQWTRLPSVWHTYFIPVLSTTWIVMSTDVCWVLWHYEDQTSPSLHSHRSVQTCGPHRSEGFMKSITGKTKACSFCSLRVVIASCLHNAVDVWDDLNIAVCPCDWNIRLIWQDVRLVLVTSLKWSLLLFFHLMVSW